MTSGSQDAISASGLPASDAVTSLPAAVLAVAVMNVKSNYGFGKAVFFGFAASLGFSLALMMRSTSCSAKENRFCR